MKLSPYLVFSISVFLASCAASDSTTTTGTDPEVPHSSEFFGKNLDRVVEVDNAHLERLIDYADTSNIHAVLIFSRGHIILEHYSSGDDEEWGQKIGTVTFDENSLHDLRSATKSVISALIGIAIDEGRIPSLDSPVSELLDPKKFPISRKPPGEQPLLLRHLLSMTAGFEWNEAVSYADPENSEIQMWRSTAPVEFALSRPHESAPGANFRYNGGLTQTLIEILEKATGVTAEDYAQEKLFGPLEIDTFSWVRHKSDQVWGASGLRMKARDFAKFGLLYLQNGQWDTETVLSERWIDESFAAQIDTGFPLKINYGLHWWLPEYEQAGRPLYAAMAQGNGGQTLLLFPEHDLLIVTFAGYYNQVAKMVTLPHKLARDFVLPALGISDARVARSTARR